MKTKDILLLGGLLAGGYFLYKYLNKNNMMGLTGGGGGYMPPQIVLPNIIINQEEQPTPVEESNTIRYDYSSSPTIPVEYIQGIDKRIDVLQNIGEQTNIPQLKTVTTRAIEFEEKKQTIGVLQNIRDKTIIPQLSTTINKILSQMP